MPLLAIKTPHKPLVAKCPSWELYAVLALLSLGSHLSFAAGLNLGICGTRVMSAAAAPAFSASGLAKQHKHATPANVLHAVKKGRCRNTGAIVPLYLAHSRMRDHLRRSAAVQCECQELDLDLVKPDGPTCVASVTARPTSSLACCALLPGVCQHGCCQSLPAPPPCLG